MMDRDSSQHMECLIHPDEMGCSRSHPRSSEATQQHLRGQTAFRNLLQMKAEVVFFKVSFVSVLLHDFKIHLPGAGDGIASKPYPFTVGDSCGMSSFPSGPTLPCLNWREYKIDELHNSCINSLIQLRNRLSCRDKYTALIFGFHSPYSSNLPGH